MLLSKIGSMAESFRRIAENKYKRALMRVVKDLANLCEGITNPREIIQIINRYSESKTFADLAGASVRRMVTATKAGQKATWRMAAAQSTKSREIYRALLEETAGTALGGAINDIIQSNSLLIRSVPRNVARKLSSIAYDATMKGLRPEEIAHMMGEKAPNLAKYQLMRVARTEATKAASALMRERCEQYGIQWYIWYTCQDERVRSSHRRMEGVYCRWNDPPCPEKLFPSKGSRAAGNYHPGGTFNCRCIALPVIDEKDIQFPAKMHFHGKIITVKNLAQLQKLEAA